MGEGLPIGGEKQKLIDELLSSIPIVVIDEEGQVFKYILIEVYNDNNTPLTFVRGFERHEYHADILDDFVEKITALNRKHSLDIKYKCVGGGRIDHQAETILIYGYSQGFGRANHALAAYLVQKEFESKKVTWKNDGY